MSGETNHWRVERVERDLDRLDTRLVKAIEDRQVLIDREFRDVKRMVAELEAETGRNYTELRTHLQSLENSWKQDRLEKAQEELAIQTAQTKQEAQHKSQTIRWGITTGLAVVALLWNLLGPILSP